MLLSGVPESAGETVDQYREIILEALSWTIYSKSQQESLNAAEAVPISNLRQVGKYRLNKPRPISITFLYNYDKSYFLNAKKHLPNGVFVENQFPKEVQQNHTILRPVLRLANNTDSYKGKCKMEGHHLIIKGT